jgi:ankyrin repeat protein
MKTKLCILVLLLAGAVAPAQTTNLTALLQQGLFEEQANRNLDAAIADYQALARQFDKDRQLAATAVFRLGECYRMQGKTNEAALEYQRIIRDFSDQTTLATLSRQNLTGMGMSPTPAVSSSLQTQKDLLGKQIALAQTKLASMQQSFQVGRATQVEVNDAESQVLRLQQQLAVLDAGKADLLNLSVPASSNEDREISRIQTMIQNSPDLINAPEPMNALGTPLVGAAYNGWLKAAAFLLDHGADVNGVAMDVAQNSELRSAGKVTPLLAAVAAGNKTMTDFLVSRGANVEFQTANGDRPLHLAARLGFQAVVEALLAQHANVNALDNAGQTPLFYAVRSARLPIVKVLLAARANVNLANNDGWTVLNRAIRSSPEMIQPLLDAGANPNTEDAIGRTPLSYAVESVTPQGNRQSRFGGRGGRGPATSSGGLNVASLNLPAVEGSPEAVKLLLAAKADPNGGKLDAPLLCAVLNGSVESAELLLAAGAKPNADGDFDLSPSRTTGDFLNRQRHLTPLWLAVYLDEPDMVQLFLKYKADPNDTQTDGHVVILNSLNKPKVLAALLDAGANANARFIDPSKRSLLQVAADQNMPDSVELFLQHGADPDTVDAGGYTALHLAAANLSDEKVFNLLLNRSAKLNVRNNEGKTPLDIVKEHLQDDNSRPARFESIAAKKAQAEKLIALLHQHGALDNLPDWDRITVSRPAVNFSGMVYQRGTNDWNHFTLLELIFRMYPNGTSSMFSFGVMSFPNLARVVVVRPSADGTGTKRIEVNLLNATNGVDCTRDVPLEFGDVVEIPEREHSLAEKTSFLTGDQEMDILNYLRSRAGEAKLVVAGRPPVPVPLQAGFVRIDSVLGYTIVRATLTSSSDLSRVKVTRLDPKTGKTNEWVFDCGDKGTRRESDLWLRDGDVIEVPAKP